MNRKLRFSLAALVLLPLLGLAALHVYILQQHPAAWYPFTGSLHRGYYVATPFGFASNVREDNPVWRDIPAINAALSRMAYVMTRGEAEADIAWLMMSADFPDKADLTAGTVPNAHESATSKAITAAGLVYERISRNDLLQARPVQDGLEVGAMQYRALLVDQAEVMAPELLARIDAIAQSGIPVFWMGKLPQRANGWADHARRDQQVTALSRALLQRLVIVQDTDALQDALQSAVPSPVLAPQSGRALKMQRRRSGDTRWALLFNDSAEPATFIPGSGLQGKALRWLDPETGSVEAVGNTALQIPAGRTRLLQIGNNTVDWDDSEWHQPGMAYRPYIRWWWPGNAVTPDRLTRELHSLHAAGFGGVEIQTLTFGLRKSQLEEQEASIYQVGTDAWFANVRHVFQQAQSLGMQVDLTLGSGWPTGGPFISEHPEQQLLMAGTALESGTTQHRLPAPSEPLYAKLGNWLVDGSQGEFDTQAVLTAVTAARRNSAGQLTDFVDLTPGVSGQSVNWAVPDGDWHLFAFYRNATHHYLLGSAYPGAALHQDNNTVHVIDHLDSAGTDEHIRKLGQPWLEKLAPYKPDAFFVDSFELIGELPWSAAFREAFQRQHGYDIAPYLPLVFRKHGESKYLNMIISPRPAYVTSDNTGQRIREDYEATRELLFRQQHVLPLKAWLAQEQVAFRLQAHGGFGDYLDTYQLADIPESEGLFANGSFEFLKLAASAGHVAGKKVISSESFVAMAMDPQQFTAHDFYYLAGNAYAAGINRLVFHGYAHAMPLE